MSKLMSDNKWKRLEMKVDLEKLRAARKVIADAGSTFCQDCGETSPSSGFYPMRITAFAGTSQIYIVEESRSLSDLLCNRCEKARRGI